MTDELDTLRDALRAAPPAPDADRKSDAIANAMSAFDDEFPETRQGSAAGMRPEKDRTIWVRLFDGGKTMIEGLTTRAGLAATSGLVAAGLAVLLVLPQTKLLAPPNPMDRPVGADPETGREAPVMHEAEVGTVAAPLAELNDAPVPDAGPDRFAARQKRAIAKGVVQRQLTTNLAGNGDVAHAARPAQEARPFPSIAMEPHTRLRPVAPDADTDTERLANKDPNPVHVTAETPVSTFSVDVDTASYAVVRSSLMSGRLPPADAVRVEEMVNYFTYDYPAPAPETAPFKPSVSVSPTPWNDATQILHIGLQGALPEISARPPLNLVFLIDTSGSMQDAAKLPLLKQSFRLMLGELRPEDQVAIVTYAGSAGQVLEPTAASDRSKILGALDRLEAGGSTAGQAGLEQAYAVAESMAEAGDVTRVLLATDGDFNVGISDPEDLKSYVERKRDSGAYLSVLGFGRGNLDDALMQALAQNGNGQAAHIDTIAEAQKVLVDQLTGNLFPIAQDVKIQVEFNPAAVSEYRLIGYETRALRREDFNNDKVDAGEIGAGHQVTALYEVTPAGSPAALNDPLRYQTAERATDRSDELGFLRLRYKAPGGSDSRLIELPIPAEVSEASVETRFATAIAGFGQLLRDSSYLGDWDLSEAARLAESARGEDRFGYRAEALRLMRLAKSLSAQ
ncbi:Ca-activated chloride channel family protein [Aliiruegeria haliotis]|uniref:Ca-activated chloride channel family protein n=1 Tax=Aliiruegeria haliotis TaxID=1280846 RepID=A0A2T0RZ31_9RHOB|nr:VWA domain-containing protein [Aliiruegeria haliotis]PRY26434.1 Ca-activated chloride channel family protein [Aliiruegeria haliotis]